MFTSEEKRILRITLRGQTFAYDPLKVRRIMLKGTGGDLYRVWRKAVSISRLLVRGEPVPEDALEAEEMLLGAAREAMGLDDPAESGEGYTDSEVWLAVDQFGAFLRKKSEGADSSPTGSAPSAVCPGSESTAGLTVECEPSGSLTPTTSPCT